MRAPVKWLKDYVDFQDTPEVLGNRLTMAGIPVEGIKPSTTARLPNIWIENIPNIPTRMYLAYISFILRSVITIIDNNPIYNIIKNSDPKNPVSSAYPEKI